MPTNTCQCTIQTLKVEQTLLTYNAEADCYEARLTITNISRRLLTGPLRVLLTRLSGGLHLDGEAEHRAGLPCLAVAVPSGPLIGGLIPGSSLTVPLRFRKRRGLCWGSMGFAVKVLGHRFQTD